MVDPLASQLRPSPLLLLASDQYHLMEKERHIAGEVVACLQNPEGHK